RPAGAPTEGRAAARRSRAAEASAARPDLARPDLARPSELLAQVGCHRRVVAERLVQMSGLGTMMPGGHLDERGAQRDPDALGLGHQGPTDAALARPG